MGNQPLADRILEKTETVSVIEMQAQLLDSMDLERERGLPLNSMPLSSITLQKMAKPIFSNLIDTPGHVDFTMKCRVP